MEVLWVWELVNGNSLKIIYNYKIFKKITLIVKKMQNNLNFNKKIYNNSKKNKKKNNKNNNKNNNKKNIKINKNKYKNNKKRKILEMLK